MVDMTAVFFFHSCLTRVGWELPEILSVVSPHFPRSFSYEKQTFLEVFVCLFCFCLPVGGSLQNSPFWRALYKICGRQSANGNTPSCPVVLLKSHGPQETFFSPHTLQTLPMPVCCCVQDFIVVSENISKEWGYFILAEQEGISIIFQGKKVITTLLQEDIRI